MTHNGLGARLSRPGLARTLPTPQEPTVTTPADELATAVETLRTARFAGAMTATPAVAALLRAREPIAKLLRETAALHTPTQCQKHEGCTPDGCDWCGDEDWPCADTRNALAVARAINAARP